MAGWACRPVASLEGPTSKPVHVPKEGLPLTFEPAAEQRRKCGLTHQQQATDETSRPAVGCCVGNIFNPAPVLLAEGTDHLVIAPSLPFTSREQV